MKLKFTVTLLALVSSLSAFAFVPSLILKNQFGEVSINQISGGSSEINLHFKVDPSNANGLGVSSVSPSNAVVYMHTSSTPATGNPNPAVGYIVVNLPTNYTGYVNSFSGFASPLSGTPINVTTGVTAGNAYEIATLGTTSAAQWALLGVPAGVVPAVNVAFIAPATATATGTGTIQAPLAIGSGVAQIDLIGDQGLTGGGTAGSWFLLRTLSATSSSVTTLVATAPTALSWINLHFSMLATPGSFK